MARTVDGPGFSCSKLLDREWAAWTANHEKCVVSRSESPLPGLWGTGILRVACQPEGSEAVGADRCLRHVPGNRHCSIVVGGERKAEPLTLP